METILSVIIPAYNAETYLTQCVNSVLAQTFTDFEVILVDDGSTDSTAEICDNFAENDSRVKAVHIKNGGVSHARNLGTGLSCGKYTAYIDSDDFLDKNHFKEMLSLMKENNSQLQICPYRSIFSDGKIEEPKASTAFSEKTSELNADKFIFLISENLIFTPWNKIFLSQIIKSNNLCFPEDMSYGEDMMFNFSYLNNCSQISFNNNPVYNYRIIGSQSLSGKLKKNLYENEKQLGKTIREFAENNTCSNALLEEMLNRRLFDCAYNSIMSVAKWEDGSLRDKRRYISDILNDEAFEKSTLFSTISDYSPKIVSAMKHKRINLLLTAVLFSNV